MNNNQLKYIIMAGIFLIPFVPLVVTKSLFFPFITGKAFFFRIIVEIIFFLWIILAIRDREYRPKFSWILGSVFLFFIVVGLADVLSANPFKSFWSNFERMEGYIALLHFAAYFLVASSVLKTREIWDKLLATSLGASVFMAIYSFLQLAGKITINQGGVRVDGTFGNASYLGIYAVFHIFFAALLFARTKNKTYRWLLAVVALLNAVVLYYTATRGAILGFLGGALIALVYLLFKAEKGAKVKKIALGFIVLVAVIAGTVFAARNTDFVRSSPVLSRFTSLSLSEIQTQGRYYVWPMAWQGFLERPVLGWGQESFNFVFNKYYDPRMYGQEPWFDRTHNIVLDWLIAAGALGLISYVLIYLASLLQLRHLPTTEKAVILGLLAAYVFHNLFVFDQIGSYILFFTLLAFLHTNSSGVDPLWWQKISNKIKILVEKESYKPVIESLSVILILSSIYFVIFVPWRENKQILAVLQLSAEGKTGEAATYKAPIRNYVPGFPEALEHVSQTAIGLASNSQVSTEMKQSIYNAIDTAFKVYVERTPNDTRYRLFYGLFLSAYGNYAAAESELEAAVKTSPKKQHLYFQLSNIELIQGKTEEALQSAKTAYDLDPSVEESKFTYGIVALMAGEEAVGKEVLSSLPEEKLIFDDRYIVVLQQLGRNDEIISVVEKRISSDPYNPQYKLNLAAAYLIAGKRESAVSVIQALIDDNPSFKEQGEYYIEEIRAGRNP